MNYAIKPINYSLIWLLVALSRSCAQSDDEIYLAGIMDTTSYTWCPDVFEFTVERLNEGYKNILSGNQSLSYTLVNSNCDETTAVTEYWKLRTLHGNQPPDGIVGARCSGASVSLARISQQEQVPHISPSSNSAKLSDNEEFPYFSRLVAPNDETGEVGAITALLDHFSWDNIIVLTTDTQFAKDLTTEFRTWFDGTIAYADTIPIEPDGSLQQEQLDATLEKIPTGHEGSRIILLAAHNQHASRVLQRAHATGFQPDSVWVGPSSWVGRLEEDQEEGVELANLPLHPGYIGVVPYRNRDPVYQEFLTGLQAWQQQRNKVPLDELPAFASETVDSILAMTQALAMQRLSSSDRSGTDVVDLLREAKFDGVSGRVQFTPEGDRQDPQYTIFQGRKSSRVDSSSFWIEVGSVGTHAGTVEMDTSTSLCFPVVGCVPTLDSDSFPSDSYPAPPVRLPGWAMAVFCIFSLLLLAMTFKYWRSRNKKLQLKQELDSFRGSLVAMRASECDYIPLFVASQTKDEESVHSSSSTLPPEAALSVQPQDSTVHQGTTAASLANVVLQESNPTIWCWKETPQCMSSHTPAEVFGDPADCWIKYTDESSKQLEASFKAGVSKHTPLQGYVVTFADMTQTKISTKFQRDVKRVVPQEKKSNTQQANLDSVRVGDLLPAELRGEPQMVLIENDVIQVSKKRDDGWAFGTKLHHANEAAARDLLALATSTMDSEMGLDANIFADTGWFPLDCTRMPSPDDLKALKNNIGDAGDLGAPGHWDDVIDPTIMQRHALDPTSDEYDKVRKDFTGSLGDSKAVVIKIERIQNLAMWQSYIVKRKVRHPTTRDIPNTDPSSPDNLFSRDWAC